MRQEHRPSGRYLPIVDPCTGPNGHKGKKKEIERAGRLHCVVMDSATILANKKDRPSGN